MQLSEKDILQLKTLLEFLRLTFPGACFGSVKIDDCSASLERAILTLAAKTTAVNANAIYDKAYANGVASSAELLSAAQKLMDAAKEYWMPEKPSGWCKFPELTTLALGLDALNDAIDKVSGS